MSLLAIQTSPFVAVESAPQQNMGKTESRGWPAGCIESGLIGANWVVNGWSWGAVVVSSAPVHI